MTGELKKRCINIASGRRHEDDIICGGFTECPEDFFCGKTNENPNYGATNFDNFMYSMLAVFQTVTLEGWSETQRMLQKAYSFYVFFFFIPLVFMGAFFLLNLTLAVINSKFTEAHHEQEAKDAAEMQARVNILLDQDGPPDLNKQDEMDKKLDDVMELFSF